MRRTFAALALAAAALALQGCSAFMPTDDDPVHMRIHWRDGFDAASRDAKATGKPILLVCAAGDLRTVC